MVIELSFSPPYFTHDRFQKSIPYESFIGFSNPINVIQINTTV